jgi:hypothetical protein
VYSCICGEGYYEDVSLKRCIAVRSSCSEGEFIAYNATQEQIFNTTTDDWYREIGKAVDKANKKMK